MPWRVSWFDQQETILIVKFMGNWSWNEFEAASDRTLALMSSKTSTVHTIYDLIQGRETPDNRVLSPMMRVYGRCPAHAGMKVIVGATPFVQLSISVVSKVMGGTSSFRYVDTVEEAAALINRLPVQNGS